MNIIIVGCGRVGTTLAEKLNGDGNEVTIVDMSAAKVNEITGRLDVMGVVGNGATPSTLHDAGIENTDLLLLEMPFSRWTEYTVKELLELASSGKFTIMLAHIERYLSLQNASVLERLYDSGILMQSNASFFVDFFKKKKALNYLKNGKIHFIGSDCHNMISRPPELQKAYTYIAKKLGEEFLTHINENGKTFSHK